MSKKAGLHIGYGHLPMQIGHGLTSARAWPLKESSFWFILPCRFGEFLHGGLTVARGANIEARIGSAREKRQSHF